MEGELKMADFGDILLRRYFEVDFNIVWDSIQDDLPKLKAVLQVLDS